MDEEIVALSEIRERAVDELQRHVSDFMALDREGIGEQQLYHLLLAIVHQLCAAILTCEQAELTRDEIVRILEPVRRVQPHAWAASALSAAIAQQHWNKVHHGAARILRTLLTNPRHTCIAWLGCGSSPDLRLIRDHIPTLAGEIWLNDASPDALRFARESLAGLGSRLHIQPGDAVRAASRLRRGAFDLVLASGVFDSLDARNAALLIRIAYRLLTPGGVFFFTCVAAGTPYRPLLDYFGDWTVVERTEKDVHTLCDQADIGRGNVAMHREETGLALIVEITKLE
jgi:SAM-dependent methyltransferase